MIVAVAIATSIFDFCENPRDAERVDNAVRVVICKCVITAINETDSDDVDAERRKFAAYIEDDGVCKDILSGSLFLVIQDSRGNPMSFVFIYRKRSYIYNMSSDNILILKDVESWPPKNAANGVVYWPTVPAGGH